jgi:hypothetical protein
MKIVDFVILNHVTDRKEGNDNDKDAKRHKSNGRWSTAGG